MRRPLAQITALIAALLLLCGCSLFTNGVYNTPLPGGADVGSHPLTLTADFGDVLDLVPQSSVKVDNVSVGRVTKIALSPDETSAHVTFLVNSDVKLPVGTTARLQTTSLLGEKYIALQRPTTLTTGPDLASGDNLGQAQTSQAAEVEQVLGALSMVLNGGDIGQFQEISRELQKISTGRSGKIRASLKQIDDFVSVLNTRRAAITDALDGLKGLSVTLNGQRTQIATALDGLSPGLKALSNQRPQLVRMLSALNRLSKVTVRTLDASQRDIVTDLKALEPILTELARSGSDLPKALQILLTYPFPDSVLGTIKGDYLNAFVLTNFRTVPTGCKAQGCKWPQISPKVVYQGSARKAGQTPLLLPSTSSATPGSPSPTIQVPTHAASTATSPSSSAKPSPDSTESSTGSSSAGSTGSAPSSPSATATGGE